MEAVDTLVKYGTSYQTKVVASLISDAKFLEQVYEITKPNFFESQANQWVVGETLKYFNEFKSSPSMEIFKIKVADIEDKVLKQTVIEQLKGIYLQIGTEDLPAIKKEYRKFAKNQRVKDALLKSVDLLKVGEYEKIIDTMNAASKVGEEVDLGLDYIAEFENIMEDVKRDSVSTGWEVIDELMKNKSYYILLDDTHHLKHFRGYEIIKNRGDFTIINSSEKNGWVLAYHKI